MNPLGVSDNVWNAYLKYEEETNARCEIPYSLSGWLEYVHRGNL